MEWKLSLFNIQRCFLWALSTEKIKNHHHREKCRCLSSGLESCYQLAGNLTHISIFSNAHSIVERGFMGLKSNRISIVNMPAPISGIAPWNGQENPFGEDGHPLAGCNVHWFDVQTESSGREMKQTRFGNIAFNLRFPVGLIFRGKLNLYLIEMAEFDTKISARYLLTRSRQPQMIKCDITEVGSPIYFDGQFLRALKVMRKVNGIEVPVFHEISADETTFYFLDQKCRISHFLPQKGLHLESKPETRIFGESENLSSEILALLKLYAKLLDLYQKRILYEVLPKECPEMKIDLNQKRILEPKSPAEMKLLNLSNEELKLVSGYKRDVERIEDFDLMNNLYNSPQTEKGLLRNCIKVYQALSAKQSKLT